MKTYRIPHTPYEVTRVAYGCMGIGGGWAPGPLTDRVRRDALTSVRAALDQGINFFDHADMYSRGRCEEAFSGIWQERPGLRDKLVLQTKCGIRFEDDPTPGGVRRYDFSREHILRSVEGSLKRLKTDYIDILLLHRPDALAEPEEIARAFDELQGAGKVRFFGVSNHSSRQIDLLRRYVRQPFVVNQLELSVVHSQLVTFGTVVNQVEPSRAFHGEGTLEYCRLNDIAIQAWSPVAHGALAQAASGQGDERMRGAAAAVNALARKKAVPFDAILLAWILRHPAGIQPIIGTTRPERIRDACAADGVEMTREEWYALLVAGNGRSVA
ncbi:MAG TPA: aldo/keto reductase [Spirochaetia bacterium]|nr:aldo/keto reductase [Spirochaetia bacterium]